MPSFGPAGKRIDFPGFFRAYVEGSDDPDAALEESRSAAAPTQRWRCVRLLGPGSHWPRNPAPPRAFTEASLVKVFRKRRHWSPQYLRHRHRYYH